MAEFQLPEMLRTPLEELILQIKVLKLGAANTFLQKAIESPPEKSINDAVNLLKDLVSNHAHPQLTTPLLACPDVWRGVDPTGIPFG